MNGNLYDMCVLEWCKLFGEQKGEHSWAKVVSNPVIFEAALFKETGLNAQSLDEYRVAMRMYRDKFVAHLDLEQTAKLPSLNIALATVNFLHAHVVEEAVHKNCIGRLPQNLPAYYEGKFKEAEETYGGYRFGT